MYCELIDRIEKKGRGFDFLVFSANFYRSLVSYDVNIIMAVRAQFENSNEYVTQIFHDLNMSIA